TGCCHPNSQAISCLLKAALKRLFCFVWASIVPFVLSFLLSQDSPRLYPEAHSFFHCRRKQNAPHIGAPLGQWTNPCGEAESSAAHLCPFRCFLTAVPGE